jgi:hypothetical protein
MDETFFDDVYRDMQTHQKRLSDEAQQHRLASQGRGKRGGTWVLAARILSWVRCRAGIWVGRSRQQQDRERMPPAVQGTETPC